MPKFITYQRPTKVDRNAWVGRQGAPAGGKARLPKSAPVKREEVTLPNGVTIPPVRSK